MYKPNISILGVENSAAVVDGHYIEREGWPATVAIAAVRSLWGEHGEIGKRRNGDGGETQRRFTLGSLAALWSIE
jgi:hypothetical protein